MSNRVIHFRIRIHASLITELTTRYLVRRHTEGHDKTEPKKLQPMRKGIADIHLRTKVSSDRINSFTEQIATVADKTPLVSLLENISSGINQNMKKYRGLDVAGKDRDLLKAISNPKFNVSSLTNKALQEMLGNSDWSNGMTGKKLSSRISRHLSLLRAHGLIKKLPNQRKYFLTDKGRKITTALNAALSASTEDLINLAA